MREFLAGKQLSSGIRNLLQAKEIRCAVAFWGSGAVQALFSEGLHPGTRIVCDLSMGGSNPAELKLLGAPANANLRQMQALHAKVYLSDRGLITSSANASNNGIGFLEVAGLLEAGTFHEPGSNAHGEAAKWFEEIWASATQIDEAALEAATRTWGRRAREGSLRLARAPDRRSLLDVVAADPQHFRGVGFVFTSGSSNTEQRDEAAAEVIKEDRRLGSPLPSNRERAGIKSWEVGNVFSEWPPEDISAWPQRFICAHQNSTGRVRYFFYERTHTAVLDGTRGMVLASRRRPLRRELGFSSGTGVMEKADAHRLEQVFEALGQDGHRLYESGEKLVEFLAALDLMA